MRPNGTARTVGRRRAQRSGRPVRRAVRGSGRGRGDARPRGRLDLGGAAVPHPVRGGAACSAGHVRVNGDRAKPATMVVPGDEVHRPRRRARADRRRAAHGGQARRRPRRCRPATSTAPPRRAQGAEVVMGERDRGAGPADQARPPPHRAPPGALTPGDEHHVTTTASHRLPPDAPVDAWPAAPRRVRPRLAARAATARSGARRSPRTAPRPPAIDVSGATACTPRRGARVPSACWPASPTCWARATTTQASTRRRTPWSATRTAGCPGCG